MTLNQIISRIKAICLAHQQLRNFYYGTTTDFLTDKTTRYASSFLDDTGGSIDPGAKTMSIGFRLYLLDLVNVSANAKENELDVQSDMLSIGMDLLAEFDHSLFTDWKVSLTNPVTLVMESLDDLVAGVMIDFTVSAPWDKDTCAVPTDELPTVINTDDMKEVYDIAYISDGTEGTTLSIPEIVGKKVILVIRENAPLHKVSISPISSEYTWNGTSIVLGVGVNPDGGERFLILYRNY
jgi:hypothetical protein